MRAQTLPASAGWRWFGQGFRLYRRSPALLALIVTTYIVILMTLRGSHWIGLALASAIQPILGQIVMNTCREIERAPVVPLPRLWAGLNHSLWPLAATGLILMTSNVAAIWLSSVLVDNGELFNLFLHGGQAEWEALEKNGGGSLLFVGLVTIPVMMACWFAPQMLVWHQQPLHKALLFSVLACFMNWRAFMIYACTLLLFCMILPALALNFLAAMLGGALAQTVVSIPYLFAVIPTLFASFYVGYREVFGVDERA